MRILFIHGRAQEEFEEAALQETWTNALHLSFADAQLPFPKNLTIDFVYYAKELIQQLDRYNQAIEDGQYVFRGAGVWEKLLNFEQEFIVDIAENAKIDKHKAQEEFGESTLERGWGNNPVATYLLRAIDNQLHGLANYSIRAKASDVGAYLVVPGVREAINGMVMDRLTDEPTIIIAHSLGTIVAYNVLKAIEHLEHQIPLLITLGSPLGVKSVQRQIVGRLRHPSALQGAWHNIYDPLDIVALNPLDEDNFNISPKINNYPIENLSENRHGIVHYLSHPQLARILTAHINTGQ